MTVGRTTMKVTTTRFLAQSAIALGLSVALAGCNRAEEAPVQPEEPAAAVAPAAADAPATAPDPSADVIEAPPADAPAPSPAVALLVRETGADAGVMLPWTTWRRYGDTAIIDQNWAAMTRYLGFILDNNPDLIWRNQRGYDFGDWVALDAVNPGDETTPKALIATANANPDITRAVIVGNEVLLRKEVTGDHLADLIHQVKSQVQVPVTYADVWEFWLQHPEIAPAVDFLTIHLLPYWEDDPSGIDQALKHVGDVRQTFGNKFAPKDILIGETGWPSEGRQRETAVPSRVNEAKFMRGFVAMAEANGWHYNLIEAFDQPWKRASEGAVGGYWGLFDADRQDKGILAGPVTNVPYWPLWLGVGGLILLGTLALGGRVRSVRAAWLLPLLGVAQPIVALRPSYGTHGAIATTRIPSAASSFAIDSMPPACANMSVRFMSSYSRFDADRTPCRYG